MRRIAEYIKSNSSGTIIYVFLVVSILLLITVILNHGLYIGIALSFLPLTVLVIYFLIRNPFLALSVLFILNYYVSGLSRYITVLSPGITMDILIVLVIIIILLNILSGKQSVELSNIVNGLTFAAFIWLIYCVFLVLNPTNFSFYGWFQSARGVTIYFLLISLALV